MYEILVGGSEIIIITKDGITVTLGKEYKGCTIDYLIRVFEESVKEGLFAINLINMED